MEKDYTLGLDIGIGSVGYAILENDKTTEEPMKIIELGVRTFDVNEVLKTGESTAKGRREKRGVRRRGRRKDFRIHRLKSLLKRTFGEDILKETEKVLNKNVYELRFLALEKRIENSCLARILLHIFKRRGFESNRKRVAKEDEDGVLKKSLDANEVYLQEKKYRTIGEAFYKDDRFKIVVGDKVFYSIRNHEGSYNNCFYRKDFEKEIRTILDCQMSFGNTSISNKFTNKVIEIFNSQRTFDEGPAKNSPYYFATFNIGKCTFIPTEERAPKASFTFEYFDGLGKINKLRLNGVDLTIEQKKILYDMLLVKKEISFTDVRKALNLSGGEFNLCSYYANKKEKDLSDEELIKKKEDKPFIKMHASFQIKKALNIDNLLENQDLIDKVGEIVTKYKSYEKIDEQISTSNKLSCLTDEQKKNVRELDFSKFGSLSLKAMKMIIPFLLKGEDYYKAWQSAGFNIKQSQKMKYLKGEIIDERLQDITNNVVRRSVNQTLRIVNLIIKKYGAPQRINIELARELSKTHRERQQIESLQQENQKSNEELDALLKKEYGILKPNALDRLKYRLYLEQNGKCIYSDKDIDINELFSGLKYEIDHILPFSRSLDDSTNNKVLVLTDENRQKGDRIPFEYFGGNEDRWNNFVARVSLLKNKEKKRRLLKTHFTLDEEQEFASRSLSDTSYMARFLLNLFDEFLEFKESKVRIKRICSIKGAITYYIRKSYGIFKLREDGDLHHAIDAGIIAVTTPKLIQIITDYNKFRDRYFVNEEGKIINQRTRKEISQEERRKIDVDEEKFLSEYVPEPYFGFAKELLIRGKESYDNLSFSEEEKDTLRIIGYSEEEIKKIKPVFVSKMKRVKKTGAIHKETIYSAREYNEKNKILIKKVPISNLKIKEGEDKVKLKGDKYPNYYIENYYNPSSDRILYLSLKEVLVNAMIEGKKISSDFVFYKKQKDGSNGPRVRKVKIYDSAGLIVRVRNGASVNDSMFRVDVFKKDSKYYLCPVYMADVYAKKLPNKLVVRDKEWITIDGTYEFIFSLYKNDLVKIKNKTPIVLEKDKYHKNPKSKKPDKIQVNDCFLYFNGMDISVNTIELKTHDSCYTKKALGLSKIEKFEKYYVDILGNIYKSPKEKREDL